MGGHGALTLALRHPGKYQTVSAFAPIATPAAAPGRRPSAATWVTIGMCGRHDATALMSRATSAPYPQGILIDQGLSDKFLATQLLRRPLKEACAQI